MLVTPPGPLTGPAIQSVAVDGDTRVTEPPVQHPCVVVGLADGAIGEPPSLDVLLTSEDAPPAPFVGCPDGVAAVYDDLAAAVERRPLASVTLAQLLRLGAPDVGGALVAESLAYGMLQSGPEHLDWLATRAQRPHRPSLSPVITELHGDRLDIRLNRPEVRNAVDVHVRDALVEALGLALADRSIAEIRLSGEGVAFCSGGDLTEFGTKPDPVTGHVVRTSAGLAWLLAACGRRLVAHVHGACVGAGVEMAAFAGRVVASADASFSLPELDFGLIPGAGGTAGISRRIGAQRTAFLALTGERIDAATALDWGLVDEIATTARLGP